MPAPKIELVPVYGELQDGRCDYAIRAGTLIVGRIYERQLPAGRTDWFWGVNGVVAGEIGVRLYGAAADLAAAKQNLRRTFDAWLEWALAVSPETHLSFGSIDKQLKQIGAR